MGDSISTFKGYSNDATNTNSAIGNNAVYYHGSDHGLTSVDQTWWKQTANLTGMNILVNNSYSGDRVTILGQTRCEQLHDDTGDNAETNPDIIAVYLGINDFDNGVETTTFATQYEAMIKKIVEKYNNSSIETTSTDTANSDDTTTKTTADIYLFTLLPNNKTTNDTRLIEYNNAIKTIASEYGCHIVDLYADSGITRVNMASYTGDTDCLHPNPAGMTLMAECFVDALYTNYVTDKS